MGLAERRIVKTYQEGTYKDLIEEINKTVEKDVEIIVDWDSISNNEYSHLWEDSFTKVYFTPLITALKEISADDMGKEALQEGLKKVEIKDENDYYSPSSAYAFEDGVLIIDHSSYSNVDNVDERSEALTKLLESNL